MTWQLEIHSVSQDNSQKLYDLQSGSCSFGREPENSIVVDSEAVSRRHGCVFGAGSCWVYSDFGSSNGSWVNGIKVESGSFRLLRHGDILRLADFGCKVKSKSREEAGQSENSVLVFFGESFEFEFELPIGEQFVVGGEGSNLQVHREGEANEQVFFIKRNPHGLELNVVSLRPKVVVNGAHVVGQSKLVDRDEIIVGNFHLVVNDVNTAVREMTSSSLHSLKQVVDAPVYDRVTLPEHLKPVTEDGWESEAARRKTNMNRKFVFGQADDEFARTQSMQAFSGRHEEAENAIQHSPLHRFSPSRAQSMLDEDGKKRQKIFLIAIGALVVLLVLWGISNVISLFSS